MAGIIQLRLKGRRFGGLVVIKDEGQHRILSGQKRLLRECLCDCGKTTYAPSDALLKGQRISCGCERKTRGTHHHCHGGDSTEYRIWNMMIQRCCNPKNAGWAGYGGRGIKVCDRWKKFTNFLEDMGPRPPGLTLNRIDNNGPYDAENCEWTTLKRQQRNRRNTRYITFKGQRIAAADVAEMYGIDTVTLYSHLDMGKDVDLVVEYLSLKRGHFGPTWETFMKRVF